MKLEDVAERLGKSKRTVMRMVDEGRFPRPAIRKGRLIYWSDAAFQRWWHRHNSGGAINDKPCRQPRSSRTRVAKS